MIRSRVCEEILLHGRDLADGIGKHMRLVTRIIILSLAGILLNIGIALACAMCVHPAKSWDYYAALRCTTADGQQLGGWLILHYSSFGTETVLSNRNFSRTDRVLMSGFSDSRSLPLPFWADSLEVQYQDVDWIGIGRGWPMITLVCELTTETPDPHTRPILVRSGIDTSLTWPQEYGYPLPRLVPVRVIWPGMLVNCLFYSTIALVVTTTPAAFRRLTRQKPGLCPECSYDLRGLATKGCPECGWEKESWTACDSFSRCGAGFHLIHGSMVQWMMM